MALLQPPNFLRQELLTRIVPWWKIEEELKKCDLLCCLCHRLIHADPNGVLYGKSQTGKSVVLEPQMDVDEGEPVGLFDQLAAVG